MAASAATPPPGPGAPSVGDDYFPDTGNGGYDVRHYGLNLDYRPETDMLTGTAVITAKATQALTSFSLDLSGFDVHSVTVNGVRATADRTDGKLRITPKKSLRAGFPFVAAIRYSGVPQALYSGGVDDVLGLLPTDEGALVNGKPVGASGWFPVNDHPSDKALYSTRITVPKGLEAISNGRLLWKRDTGDSSVWFWNTEKPMASYLATAAIGQFDISAAQVDGIRYLNAIEPGQVTPEIVPHSGTDFAFSGQEEDTYKRFARTMRVAADDPRLSFWIDYETVPAYNFAFVEILPEDGIWRTLPDENGILKQDAGERLCEDLLSTAPFLRNYLTLEPFPSGDCDATGFWAVSGDSEGWDQWEFDLSAYVGQDVYISVTYVSQDVRGGDGVAIDDIEAPGGIGSTSFEEAGDVLRGWTATGAPQGRTFNQADWTVGDYGPQLTRYGDYGPSVAGVPAGASLARQPELVAFLEESFGPYPFNQLGGVVVDSVADSVENQTRPIYSRAESEAMVHQIAHQWFGSSLTPDRWQDIWLNEGFATYAEWLWLDVDTQESFDRAAAPQFEQIWDVVIGNPGPQGVTSTQDERYIVQNAVAVRGAMTLHALRERLGDEEFFDLLKTWTADNAHGNVTTADFIELAEQTSGQDLDAFFDEWLYTAGRPAGVPVAG